MNGQKNDEAASIFTNRTVGDEKQPRRCDSLHDTGLQLNEGVKSDKTYLSIMHKIFATRLTLGRACLKIIRHAIESYKHM